MGPGNFFVPIEPPAVRPSFLCEIFWCSFGEPKTVSRADKVETVEKICKRCGYTEVYTHFGPWELDISN